MPTGSILKVASGKKEPDRPEYDLFNDTDYITQSRGLEGKAYKKINNLFDSINSVDSSTRAGLQSVADQYTANQWRDYNRNSQQQANKTAQGIYNRFGGTRSTAAGNIAESLNRQQQAAAGNIASNTASQYQNLVNQEMNNRQNALGYYSNLWNTAGSNAYQHDYTNYQTEMLNKDIQYENDLRDYNQKISALNAINQAENKIGGAVASIWLGPMGEQLGEAGQALDDGIMGTNNMKNFTAADRTAINNIGAAYGSNLNGSWWNKQGINNLSANNDSSLLDNVIESLRAQGYDEASIEQLLQLLQGYS